MANDFAIEITADDAATAIIEKVNQALSKMTGNIEKSGKGTKGISDQARSSLGKLEDSFKKVERSASLVVDKIVEIVPGLAAIGGIGAIGAISEKFATFGQKLTTNARLVGMNTRELLKFEYAARRAGQSSESIVSTLSSMQDAIRGAAMGQNPQAMAQLLGWGVNLKRNADGSVANMDEVVLQVMDKIGAIKSAPAQRYAAGLFGATGSLPMIQQGQYRADMARANQPGFLPTDEEIAKGEALKKQLADLGQAFDTLTTKMGSDFMPIIGPLVDGFTKILSSSNGRVAAEMAVAFTAMFSVISVIKIASATAKFAALGSQLASAAGAAGPVTGALGAVVGALSTLGVAAVAAWGALKVAQALGLPDVDNKQGAEDVRKGNWLAASTHLPAGDFLRAMAARAAGKSNDDIAASLAAGVNPNAKGGVPASTPAQAAAKAASDAVAQAAASAAQATAPASAVAQTASGALPLGIRSNNPLNVSPNGQEAIYASAEDGIAAATYNLRKNYQGLTLAQISDKWTGGARTGNSATQQSNYLAMLTQGTGLGANAVPDLNNQQLVAAMLTKQIQAENGTNSGQAWYTPDQIAAGVTRGFGGRPAMIGTSDAGQSQAAAARGGGNITVTFDNVPKGTRVEAKTNDGGWMPTRINYSLSN
jgi:hypothetical protein